MAASGSVCSAEGSLRYADGRFALAATPAPGLPEGSIRALALGGEGSVWLASARGGIGRIEARRSLAAALRGLRVSEGLSSGNAVLVEDSTPEAASTSGQSAGLERLDPATGNVQRFTADDGLLGA